MKKLYFSFLLGMCCTAPAILQAQAPLSGSGYSQDFNTLSGTTASNILPSGWQILETGTSGSVNGSYSVGTGSGNAGDVYSFGASGSTERALGTLLSGTLKPTIGASFTNNTGSTVTSLTITYTGELWRLGATTRKDRLDFQLSLNATSLGTGNWTDIDALDFETPNLSAAGARNGNADENRIVITHIVTDVNIPAGSTFYIRWTDFDAASSDDGLAIDDFTISTGGPVKDTYAPAITTYQPEKQSTGIVTAVKPSLVFDEGIQKIEGGTGTISVVSTGGDLLTLPIADSRVVVNGNTLRLDVTLKPSRTYTIAISADALEDASGNDFAGITDWSFTTGEQKLFFDFNDCNGNALSGFTQYSVTGAQTWSCGATFGVDRSGSIQINGYAGGAQENEDWLISPSFDLSTMPYPVLSFATISAFEGPGLKLVVSTDYDGTSHPRDFTWTEIRGHFPAVNSAQWTTSSQIDLRAFKGDNVYIAFVYTSSPQLNASRWTLDNFRITKDVAPEPVVITSPSLLNFDYAKAGTQSASSLITVDAYNLQNAIAFTAPAGFELSLDNSVFSKTVQLPKEATEAGVQNLYVRFVPTTANVDFSGKIIATSEGVTRDITSLSGTSLRALKVVNWNVEWFGGPNGPTNDSQQQENVKTILQKLNADVYALSEVVNIERLEAMVAQMPGYAYTINDYGSYADDPSDPDYATAQKLAFIYKADVVKSISTYGVLRNGGSSSAYNNWASGRFPYLMKAEVNLEGVTTTINFILVHGKANTGDIAEQQESWMRRKGAADELRDSLNAQYPFANIIMLGDFNDDLDKTIATGIPGDVTSYVSFVQDEKNYKPITLPLSLSGSASTTSYADMIDHQVASNETGIAYVPQSAHVANYVSSWVSSYGSSTSDHYPVVARYDLRYFARPIDFKGFTGTIKGGMVAFEWITSHEINSHYFVVERSRNGINFEPIDSVQGLGTSRTGTAYSLEVKPWPGQTHYRLRVTSLDGSVAYSHVQTINMKKNSSLLSASAINPSLVRVAYITQTEKQGRLELVDLNGRVHFSRVSKFAKGQSLCNIDTHRLPAGLYIVRIVYADGIESEKLYLNK
ncbi:choice-of-anchor J domain-containing protein [Flavisolibacter sp. BT320]|nr:choice-of-anchor J domain-containing protein [Flavisolibacter longurius]